MIYVALLRGINVGGNNTIVMRELSSTFGTAGMAGVRTYINSGNVIFTDEVHQQQQLTPLLERAIEQSHGFYVDVIIKSIDEMRAVAAVLPEPWQNGADMKCDVVFLRDTVKPQTILSQLTVRPGIDDIRAAPGAIIWKVDRVNAAKSGLLKLIGTPLYRQVTVRNCNTLRKLLVLMEQTGV